MLDIDAEKGYGSAYRRFSRTVDIKSDWSYDKLLQSYNIWQKYNPTNKQQQKIIIPNMPNNINIYRTEKQEYFIITKKGTHKLVQRIRIRDMKTGRYTKGDK